MSHNALSTLLRGCKRTHRTSIKPPPLSSSPPSSPSPQLFHLPPELDFFNNSNQTIPSPTPSQPSPSQPSPPQTPAPQPSSALESVISNHHLLSALQKLNISELTPIQRRVIPLFTSNHDIIAISPTGSGKTLAYLLPLLHLLHSNTPAHPATPSSSSPRVIILAPTRELADQITRVATRLIRLSSLPIRLKSLLTRAATASLHASPPKYDILIATPQRLVTSLSTNSINLQHLQHLVFDEADELFQPKFLPQIDPILTACGLPTSRIRLHLFSATLPPSVDELVRGLLLHPRKVVVDAAAFGGAAAVSGLQENIDQKFVFVGGRGEQGKVMAVRSLLKEGILPPVLLFVQTKERAAELFRELVYGGMRVDAIHADRSDAARRSAVARFRTGKIWMLIATDVLARGLDFLAVNTVINYDMPSSGTAYVHRIGRTGRNGRRGKAITFFTEEDQRVVAGVVKVAKASGAELPDWLVALAARVRKDEERRLESRPPVRNRIGGPNRASLRRGRKRKGGAHEGDVKGERDADADGDEGEDRDEKGDGVNEARSKRVRGEKYDDLGDNDSKNGSCEVGKQQKEKKKRKRKD